MTMRRLNVTLPVRTIIVKITLRVMMRVTIPIKTVTLTKSVATMEKIWLRPSRRAETSRVLRMLSLKRRIIKNSDHSGFGKNLLLMAVTNISFYGLRCSGSQCEVKLAP